MTRSIKSLVTRFVSTCLLAVLIACALSASSASAALVADYPFDDNLNSSVGLAPSLTEVGAGATYATEVVNGTTDRVRVFPAGAGLSLPTTGLVSPSVYTFEMTFRLSEASTWERIFDASDASSDNGVYVKANKLDYYDNHAGGDHFGTGGFAADTYYTVSISRSASGLITIYQDGALQIAYNDTSSTGVLLAPDYLARFFVDDNIVSGENSPGAVSRIRVFDNDIPLTLPDEGKNGTATRVNCNFVVATGLNTCIAQVGDARPGSIKRPTGTVKFSSGNGGSFVTGTTCELIPTSASRNVSSCSVQYVSPSNTFPKVAAAYLGSAEHTPSTGTTTFYILGSRVGGFGIDLGAEPTLGKRTSGPMTVGCVSRPAEPKSKRVRASGITSTECMYAINAAIEREKNEFVGKPCLGAKTYAALKDCNPRYEEALEEWERLMEQRLAKIDDQVKQRADKWDELKDILDDYNKAAKDVINSVGKKSSVLAIGPQAAKQKQSKSIAIGNLKTVVKGGKSKTVRLRLTRQWKPLLTMIRRMNKAMPGLNLDVNVSMKVQVTRRSKGARPKRTVLNRLVTYKVTP